MKSIDSIIHFVNSLPFVFKALLIASILLLAFSIIIVLIIFIIKIITRRKHKKSEKLRDEWKELLIPMILEGNADKKEMLQDINIPKLRKAVSHNKFNQNVLREQLMYFNRQFRGNAPEVIHLIYSETGLKKILINELLDSSWKTKVRALIEMKELGLRPPQDILVRLLDEKNGLIRAETIFTITKFYCPEGLDFLRFYAHEISLWEQIQMFSLLRELPKDKLPVFSIGFENSNESAVVFCIRMAGHFRQFDAKDRIEKFAMDGTDKVKTMALKALQLLGGEDARAKLKEVYHHNSQSVQEEIIHLFGVTADYSDLEFLDQSLQAEGFRIKKAAAMVIAKQIPGGKEYLRDNYARSEDLEGRIVNQVLKQLNFKG